MSNYKDSRAEINLEEGCIMVKGTNLDFLVKCIGIGLLVFMSCSGAAILLIGIAKFVVII